MSTQYIAVIVGLLATFLPRFGIQFDNQLLTSVVTGLAAVGSGLWIMYQRTTLQKAPGGFGDVTASGARK